MSVPRRILYELAGANPDLRFSPHCWKTRLALAHKGLVVERRPWRFTEKEMIAFSKQGSVPVLVDGDQTISDSWNIACYLEEAYPDRPSLFGDAAAMPPTRFINDWADAALAPALLRLLLLDIYDCISDADRPYFRASREQRFGQSLEAAVADRDAHKAALGAVLAPLRHTLKFRPFLAGESMAYADYCVFGFFMWARCVSRLPLLAEDDRIHAWRERMLDAYDGMGRSAPSVASGHGD